MKTSPPPDRRGCPRNDDLGPTHTETGVGRSRVAVTDRLGIPDSGSRDTSEPTLLIVGRKRGRPPAAVPSAPVGTRLPVPLVDLLAKVALKHGVSLSEVTRRAVLLGLKRL